MTRIDPKPHDLPAAIRELVDAIQAAMVALIRLGEARGSSEGDRLRAEIVRLQRRLKEQTAQSATPRDDKELN